MNLLGAVPVWVLLVGAWAQGLPGMFHLPCDSPEAEAAALVAQDYLNAQHTHGYKYALNQIEEIKIITTPGGGEAYLMDLELLETTCHVLDPTPVANCTVRPKYLTSVEADCDVVLSNVGGVLSVTSFKCKTEESTEDICLGCPMLLPLNDTAGLELVSASLASFNNKTGNESLFALEEVGRMTSKVVSPRLLYQAEYIITETNCTIENNNSCVPLPDPQRGFCQAQGGSFGNTVDCMIFVRKTVNGTNDTVPAPPPVVHVHTGNLLKPGLRHHKLTYFHDPDSSGILSAESHEVVPVVPKVTDVPATTNALNATDSLAVQPTLLVPLCPGKVKHF
ncbi:alpha-2-HS-glycoprotein 2 isoform X1 [Osmerus eperlanus]|uniref:alpha-2-HS-glycoprotein 2 isoform X1 n=1 Tax=Osmerus eperlanus TaxID=29151 RepID=UPI002E12E5BD